MAFLITSREKGAAETARTPLELIEMETPSAEIQKVAEARRDAGQIELENIPVEPAKVSNSNVTFSSESYPLVTLRKGAASKTFANGGEFKEKGLETKNVPSRIYRSQYPFVEVIVPEQYAKQLDAVRELRRQLETETSSQQSAKILQQLQDHPLGDRALPEDIFAIIDALPTKNVIERVLLSGEPNPYDIWYKKLYGDWFVSAADTGKYGDTAFYQRSVDRYLAEEMFHEWGHNAPRSNRQMSKLFKLARTLEPDGNFSREYAKQPDEALPVNLGEQLMGLSGAESFAFGLGAPIRAAVLSRGLRQTIQSGYEMHEPSSLMQPFTRRLDMIDAEIAPIARAKLIETANNSTDATAAHDAALLLAFIGKPSDMARLTKTESLDFSQIPMQTETVEGLQFIPNLRHLNLNYTGLSSNDINSLTSLTRLPLETLGLTGLAVMNYHLYPVARLKTLRSLDVSDTLVNDGAIPLFSNMRLRFLNAGGSQMTDAGKQSVRDCQPEAEVK